MNTNINLI